MGERVSEFGLGFTVPEKDPRELYKAIDKFFSETRHWPPDQNLLQIETYKRKHSVIALDEFLKEVVSKPRAQLSKT
jgi:hypothetical protein